MRRLLSCLVLVVACALAADQKPKQGKEPDLMVDEFHAYRQSGRILVDGTIVANREMGIKGVHLKVEVMAPDDKLISWQQAQITKDTLEAGEKVTFYLQFNDQARAVAIRLDFTEVNKLYLTADKPGPYWIE